MTQVALKVVLVNPPQEGRKVPSFENLGIGYLAAVLRRNGFHVIVIDAMLEELDVKGVVNKIIQASATLLGISATQAVFGNVAKIVSMLREKWSGAICLGGHLATFYDKRALEETNADFVVRKEGEYPFLELAKMLDAGLTNFKDIHNLAFRTQDGIVRNPIRERIRNLDHLPFPTRDTTAAVIRRGSWVGVSSSRGCNGHCTFCTVNRFYEPVDGSSWVGRSARNVVDEIEVLVGDYGARKILFVDDNFLGNDARAHQRAYEVAALLLERKIDIKFGFACRPDSVDKALFTRLVEAGLDWVFVGYESGCSRALKRFGKGLDIKASLDSIEILRNLRVGVEAGFIMFDPDTTKKDISDNLAFLEKMPEAFLFSNMCSRLDVLCGSAYGQKYGERLQHGSKGSFIPYKFSPGIERVYCTFGHLVEAIDRSNFELIHKEIKERLLFLVRRKVVPESTSGRLLRWLTIMKSKYILLFRLCLNCDTETREDYAFETLEKWFSRDIAKLVPIRDVLREVFGSGALRVSTDSILRIEKCLIPGDLEADIEAREVVSEKIFGRA